MKTRGARSEARGRARLGPFPSSIRARLAGPVRRAPRRTRRARVDDLWVVRGSRNDSDALLECVELLHALLSAHADHVVLPVKRVLHHVPPELPRGPDDANPHRARLVAPSSGESVAVAPVLKDSRRCLMSPR